MTHPITPPPELVLQWFLNAKALPVDQWVTDIATCAAQWAADEELDACCEVLGGQYEWDQLCQCTGWKEFRDLSEKILRAARRPKPLSLKEQALQALGRFNANAHISNKEMTDDFEIIRCALLQLHD